MRHISISKLLLVFITSIVIGGCYEKHLTAKYVNPEQIWLVNNTGETFDSLNIANQNTFSYYIVPVGASFKVMFPTSQELIITEPGLCKEMLPTDSYVLTNEERKKLNTKCPYRFTFTKEDLYKVAEPLLTEEYITCVILYPDGTLEARTEHSTPWPSSYGKTRASPDKHGKTRSPCSTPDAEQAMRFIPR